MVLPKRFDETIIREKLAVVKGSLRRQNKSESHHTLMTKPVSRDLSFVPATRCSEAYKKTVE